MIEEAISKMLEETQAVKNGHFQLSSGLHSGTYFQCAKLLEHPKNAGFIGEKLAELFEQDDIDLVASPAMGGIIIGFVTAEALNIPFVFTERDASAMRLRRGFEIEPNQKVLIVEDVLTTGGSAAEVAKLIEKLGATVVGIGAIVQRAEISLPYDTKSLLKMETTAYKSFDCPLCKQGIPLQSPGSKRIKVNQT